MKQSLRLSAAERAVEEIRAIRRRIWSEGGGRPSQVLDRVSREGPIAPKSGRRKQSKRQS